MNYTISVGRQVLCKALNLDGAIQAISDYIEDLNEDDGADIHIWREKE